MRRFSLYRKGKYFYARFWNPETQTYRGAISTRETENELVKPTEVYAKANHPAWFRCPTCGRSYRARISHRTDEGSGCPYCSGHAVAPDQSLAALHPSLMTEWHPVKNGDLDPYTLTPKSDKYVWWVCPHGDEYKAPPSRRVGEFDRSGRYSGCDRCYHEGRR